MTTAGIDVSGYQGTIDWGHVSTDYAFAYIKATEGEHVTDSHFERNADGCALAGMISGAYHFFRPTVDATLQAERFLKAIENRTSLPPALDVEVWDGVEPEKLLTEVLKWIDIVGHTTGVTPVLYTSPSFWARMPKSPIATSIPALLWVAHWGVTTPDVPSPSWDRWTFWQNSAKGHVQGIEGDVDLDVYNGSLDELRRYLTGRSDTIPVEGNVTPNPGDDTGETGRGNRGEETT